MFKFRLIVALMLGAALAMSVMPADAARNKKEEKSQVSKSGREDKKPISSKKFVKSYGHIADKYESDDYDGAMEGLDKLDSPKLSPYERAKVAQMRGFIYYNQDQVPEAIEQFKLALATDALPNAEHFQLKLTMAELYHINDQLTESAAVFDDWTKDAETITGRNWALQAKNYFDQDDYEQALVYLDKAFATGDKPERSWQQMKANALLSLERTDEAIAFGREVLAQAPDDPEFVNFLTALLLDADKPQDAVTILEDLRAQGKLGKENLYVNLYAAYRDLERPKDAAATMSAGLSSGVVKETKDRYLQVGEAYYDAESLPEALAGFRRAAELSDADGTADLYVGQVLLDQEKPKEAREAFTAAIQKGNLRQPGNAYYQLGIAELDSDNEAAAIAAFKKAQGYPESNKNATQALKSLGR
ncbi:MAG: tetratricopeptide repeat protein [Rhodanobacteraceae bacterium]|nr:tetratricopeptide repeat protein [Xanthomonadales bacterium]MCP5473264.1 tetratricopeptide repeat protein [Rhodanobacteraceae bacterium]